uniref:Centrosomal protein 97 n=2 Tax=Myripristis murdjan TaxID=586833 RepID=A0A667YTN9_9TELE
MKAPAAAPAAVPLVRETEPAVQYNTWIGSDSSHPSVPMIRSPRVTEEPIHLEDVQTDEDKLNGSLLSSESTFLPFTPDLEPQQTRSDSEDETETFEPDSLAPERPAQLKKLQTDNHSPSVKEREQVIAEEEVTSVAGQHNSASATTAGPLAVSGSPPQSDLEASADCGKEEMKEGPKQEEVVICPNKSNLDEADRAAVKIQSWWRGQHTRHCHPMAREVRGEIRLRRMQEHILFLSGELERVQKQYEEERLQRLVQEEAVKFMWKQLQSMQQWQQSVEQQLASVSQAVTSAQISAPALCGPALPVGPSTTDPGCTDVSFPDSGFQSTSEQQAAQQDSFMSSGTADSLETVRALTSVTTVYSGSAAGGVDSPDCSLLEQYLSSVQQREEEAEEGAASDRTETPQPSSPLSPSKAAQPNSPPQDDKTADNKSEAPCKPEASPNLV